MADTTIEPFVRNAWYLAAWPEELAEGMVSRTIMNEPLVLFRDASGAVAALEDRCCHRGAPLTHGEVVPEGIQCGYHGLIFDCTGACVKVPGQDSIPRKAVVRSYPVVERQQFIWIWMGDPALADASQIIDYPYHDQPDKWPHRKAVFPIKANYMMMIDNLMDLSHLAYVHTKTIGGSPNAHANAQVDATPTDNGVHYVRWMLNSPPPPTYVKALGFQGKIDRWQEFEYVAPSSVLQWTGAIDAGKGAQENQDQDGFHIRLFHSATPETETSFHYFWSTANGYRTDDPQATQDFYDEVYPTFLEDKVIMEAQQERLNLDPERELVAIRADRALILARRAIRRLIEAEYPQMPLAGD